MNREPGTHPLPQRHVAILAFEGCETLDACGPMEVFGIANRWLQFNGQIEEPTHALSMLAERARPLTTSSGLRMVADCAIGESDEGIDTLLVASGLGVEETRKSPALLAWLGGIAGRVQRLGSICTGAFLLAESATSIKLAFPWVDPIPNLIRSGTTGSYRDPHS